MGARIYDFAALAPGERLVVALNGDPADAVRARLNAAAGQYRRMNDPNFQFTTSTRVIRNFVVLERIAPGTVTRLRRERLASSAATIERLSRERPLHNNEIDRLSRLRGQLRSFAA